jgi:hypothetical protein
MRQVLESDRKIRAVSLVKFSGFTLSEIDQVIESSSRSSSSQSESACSQSHDDSIADIVAASPTYNVSPSASDANVIYYVGGAIARSVVRTTKCDDCREYDQLEPIQLDESIDYTAAAFLNSVNRGGLSRPTNYCFTTTVQCWRVYDELKSSTELLQKLLRATNQRAVFVGIIDRAVCDDQLLVEDNCCTKGHDLKTLITCRFFNCVAKNIDYISTELRIGRIVAIIQRSASPVFIIIIIATECCDIIENNCNLDISTRQTSSQLVYHYFLEVEQRKCDAEYFLHIRL